MPGVWFNYTQNRGTGHWLPVLRVSVRLDGREAKYRDFIVDTGASCSFAPLSLVLRLGVEVDAQPLADLRLKGAGGKRLRGFYRPVEVVVPRLGVVKDVIAFSPDIKFELLGQSQWFEQVGAKFENFAEASTGRRFGLHHRYRG